VIITETIEYIKELEKKKKMLEEVKESMKLPIEGSLLIPCRNRNCCSVSVTVSSNVAFFGIESVAKPGLITGILKVFFDNHAEILAVNVSVNDGNLILAITALVQNGSNGHGNSATVEKIKREIMSL
jgi:predicted amino acid-binding ACT domain protein